MQDVSLTRELPVPVSLQSLKSVPHAAKVQTVGCRELERSVEFADQHGERHNFSSLPRPVLCTVVYVFHPLA